MQFPQTSYRQAPHGSTRPPGDRTIPTARDYADILKSLRRDRKRNPFDVYRLPDSGEYVSWVRDEPRDRYGDLTGVSPEMQKTFVALDEISQLDVNVVIFGETGTGKELAARAIHDHSPRRRGPFVVLDCGWLPEGDLATGAIFGHTRGAFTGATSDVVSVFEQSHGGTLFIDEIGELPIPLQPKLLRALQEGQIRRLGGNAMRTVDVRVIAATHRDLARMVDEGSFREDLYYRLRHVSISLPPLRERPEDIVWLANRFLATERESLHLAADAIALLERHPWPGNVRELQSAMRVAARRTVGGEVTAKDLALLESPRSRNVPTLVNDLTDLTDRSLDELLAHVTIRYLEQLATRYDWNIGLMAHHAGYSRSDALRRVLDRHDVTPPPAKQRRRRSGPKGG